jgi:hypothetical protein
MTNPALWLAAREMRSNEGLKFPRCWRLRTHPEEIRKFCRMVHPAEFISGTPKQFKL